MTTSRLMPALLVPLVAGALHAGAGVARAQQGPPTPWTAVDQALGRTGTVLPGGVHKYAFPRSDLRVEVDGVRLLPALALGSWIAFHEVHPGHVMAMGDLVLLEREVTPVMRALQAAGIEQTALHNHVLRESPRVMYMHVAAMGDPVRIARGVAAALRESATPTAAPPPPTAGGTPSAVSLDTAAIARVLGVHGTWNGGVYQVSVPRRDTTTMHGSAIHPSLGIATAINFQPTAAGKAVATGDFVLRPGEVNGVIRALQRGGIEVTALHSHMLDEEPRLFFMHFWGNAEATELAATLRGALDAERRPTGS